MTRFDRRLSIALRGLSSITEDDNLGAAAGSVTGNNQPSDSQGGERSLVQQQQGAQRQDAQKQAEQAKKKADLQRKAMEMGKFDQDIAKQQTAIDSGGGKPADTSKLSQLLTAKKSLQDQIMQGEGLPT